jgi:hypothetical protein
VSGGIGAEGEVVLLGRVAQLVEHEPRLDPRPPGPRVEVEDPVEMLGEVEDDRDVAALACEARAAAARQHRRAEAAAHRQGRGDILEGAGDHDADRHLAVVRGVGGVERAAAVVEAHLPSNVRAQLRF